MWWWMKQTQVRLMKFKGFSSKMRMNPCLKKCSWWDRFSFLHFSRYTSILFCLIDHVFRGFWDFCVRISFGTSKDLFRFFLFGEPTKKGDKRRLKGTWKGRVGQISLEGIYKIIWKVEKDCLEFFVGTYFSFFHRYAPGAQEMCLNDKLLFGLNPIKSSVV